MLYKSWLVTDNTTLSCMRSDWLLIIQHYAIYEIWWSQRTEYSAVSTFNTWPTWKRLQVQSFNTHHNLFDKESYIFLMNLNDWGYESVYVFAWLRSLLIAQITHTNLDFRNRVCGFFFHFFKHHILQSKQ